MAYVRLRGQPLVSRFITITIHVELEVTGCELARPPVSGAASSTGDCARLERS